MAHAHTEMVKSAYEAIETGDSARLGELVAPEAGLEQQLMAVRCEPEWYARSGDGRVLVFVQLTGEGGETTSGAHVWMVEGDRITGFESFAERASAMEVLGPDTLIQDE